MLYKAYALFCIYVNAISACSRIPVGTTASKSPVDEHFTLSIDGNPTVYVPGENYNVSLSSHSGFTFIGFMIEIERDPSTGGENDAVNWNAGHFSFTDTADIQFSLRCPNVLENTNTNVKTRINLIWHAPTESDDNNMCILLRATIIQHRDVWFKDDGLLTRRLCREEVDDIHNQPSIVDPCCACDEAKYELTFEGKWSRHTHPKDFPANNWETRFSDIIGASHSVDYRFWQYGELASEGLREASEHGSTKTLESELKNQSSEIRTIIKARGIAFPNVTGKSSAVFRVDPRHHLISLVSMIYPSPDWILGVSGLELCLPNCSWIESKKHSLYPWDAGTDAGPSYMSADQPQIPPDVVRRIKANSPNDPRSPFQYPQGEAMKPLAILHIQRRRLYQKTCTNTEEEEDAECATFLWTAWSKCTAPCGPGKQYRTREFKNQRQAQNSKCRTSLREERACNGQDCEFSQGGDGEDNANIEVVENNSYVPECVISDWSEWSRCSVTCGEGIEMRSRRYLNPRAKKKCQKVTRVRLQETRKCSADSCGGDIGNENSNGEPEMSEFKSYSQVKIDMVPPECLVSPWSDFSTCTGSCNEVGQRHRVRNVWKHSDILKGITDNIIVKDNGTCGQIRRIEIVNCTNPDCSNTIPSKCYETIRPSPCRKQNMQYWYYDHKIDQCAQFTSDNCDSNKNKFNSQTECQETCQPEESSSRNMGSDSKKPIDCQVSKWHSISCNATCETNGIQLSIRQIIKSPRYGGKPCPKYFLRTDRCSKNCNSSYFIRRQLP